MKKCSFSWEMSFTHFISGHNVNKCNPCNQPLASFSRPQAEKAEKKVNKHDGSQCQFQHSRAWDYGRHSCKGCTENETQVMCFGGWNTPQRSALFPAPENKYGIAKVFTQGLHVLLYLFIYWLLMKTIKYLNIRMICNEKKNLNRMIIVKKTQKNS